MNRLTEHPTNTTLFKIKDDIFLSVAEVYDLLDISDPVAVGKDRVLVSAKLVNESKVESKILEVVNPYIDWQCRHCHPAKLDMNGLKIVDYLIVTDSSVSRNGGIVVKPGETVMINATMQLPYEAQKYLAKHEEIKDFNPTFGFLSLERCEMIRQHRYE